MFGRTAIVTITNIYGPPMREAIHFSDTPSGTATDKAIQFAKDAVM